MTIEIDPIELARMMAKVLVCLILAVFFLLKFLPDCDDCYRIGFIPSLARRIGRWRLNIYCQRCWRRGTR